MPVGEPDGTEVQNVHLEELGEAELPNGGGEPPIEGKEEPEDTPAPEETADDGVEEEAELQGVSDSVAPDVAHIAEEATPDGDDGLHGDELRGPSENGDNGEQVDDLRGPSEDGDDDAHVDELRGPSDEDGDVNGEQVEDLRGPSDDDV